jgi:hypothetical protein
VARWRAETEPGVPERLCRFIAGEWPGGTVAERAERYKRARLDYLAEHGGRVVAFGGKFGDLVDVLADAHERRLILAAGQLPG